MYSHLYDSVPSFFMFLSLLISSITSSRGYFSSFSKQILSNFVKGTLHPPNHPDAQRSFGHPVPVGAQDKRSSGALMSGSPVHGRALELDGPSNTNHSMVLMTALWMSSPLNRLPFWMTPHEQPQLHQCLACCQNSNFTLP